MSDVAPRLTQALEGRYRIERKLGEGGMATVYLAEDLRHERQVAVKVLRPELAAVVGGERFLAEIKTTANLQHPNILPLFDSGEADSFLYYVMPYVEGESLRDRLDRERQLPVDEAVRIATDVADALSAAHEQGVIHRDIKPANILLSKGRPLVADFGIALAVSTAGGGRLTETGLSMGTPYYMSPEQASADREPSAASDVYSLGCVLYEMLVGEPPYAGGSAQAVLAKILTEDAPAATKARRSIPAHVDAAIRKALEKLPADRFVGAEDFAAALEDPKFRYGDGAVGQGSASAGLWNPLSMTTSALALLFALGLAWSALGPSEPPSSPPTVSRQVISAPPSVPVAPSPVFQDVVISSDGRNVVYQSSWNPGTMVLRPLDQLESPPLQGQETGGNVVNAFLSPDGEWVAFQRGASGSLQRASILGGPALTITDLRTDLLGAAWGTNDTIVFGQNAGEGLWQVPASGGEPTPLTTTDGNSNHSFPDVLPNGRGVLFVVNTNSTTAIDNQIAVLDRRTGEHRVIIPSGTSPRYVSTGHIVYASGNTLRAVAFDAERLEVLSDPVPVAEGVMSKTNGAANFSVSETGSLVYVSGTAADNAPRRFVWVDRDGNEEALPLPQRAYQNPRLSPDGTRVAVGVPDESGVLSLWVFDVTSAAGLRLTQQGSINTPVWISNDRIAFSSDVTGPVFQLHAVMADGSAPPEQLLISEGIFGDFPTSVSPQGEDLVFSRMITGTHREIYRVPVGSGEPVPESLLRGEFNRGNGEASPDGRWLVYRSDQSGQMEVYLQPYPGPGPTVPASIGGGTSVTWSPDGTELIYRLGDRVMAASVTEVGETVRVGQPTELFRGSYFALELGGTRQYHVAPDGRFLMLKDVPSNSLGEQLPPQVVLVQNWLEELRERIPQGG